MEAAPERCWEFLKPCNPPTRTSSSPWTALRYIADETGVPPARVYSAATFYALFNLDPQGDNVICVCRGTACHTRGSRDLLDKLCLDLGLSDREADENSEADKLALTTADRRFTVRTVACFGQCALAPVVEVNHHILSHVNERTLAARSQVARPKGGSMRMPRIQDIGAFNAVRESGLAKLTPSIPRITVGMGTCGRGNGAEEVFHALNEAIQRSGLDVAARQRRLLRLLLSGAARRQFAFPATPS